MIIRIWVVLPPSHQWSKLCVDICAVVKPVLLFWDGCSILMVFGCSKLNSATGWDNKQTRYLFVCWPPSHPPTEHEHWIQQQGPQIRLRFHSQGLLLYLLCLFILFMLINMKLFIITIIWVMIFCLFAGW
jgi:hypothetical protein